MKPRETEGGIGVEALGAIAAIFVPLLIEKAIGGISAALKKAGEKETLRDSGRLPTYLYRLTRDKKLALNPDLECVVMVRGSFFSPDPDQQPEITFNEQGVFTEPADESRRVRRLTDNGIPVKTIAAVYEAAVIASDDKTALRYESRFLEVNAFQGSRSASKRTLVVSIAINGAGEKEGEPTLSLALMNLGEVTRGAILGPEKLKSRGGSWLGGLGISDASAKALEVITFPEQPTDAAHPKYKKFLGIMPVTVEGTLAETEKGRQALRFIAEVLDAAKGDVSKTLSDEILKDRGKASAEAADAREGLRQAEESAYAEYLEAEAAYAQLQNPSEQERAVKEFDRQRKKRAWCLKFRAVDKVGLAPTGRPPCTNADVQ